MQIELPITSRRITLRNARKADLPFLTAMWFDQENGRYLSDPTFEYVDDKFRAALDGIETNPNGYYLTALLTGTEQIIGSCFIFPDEKGESAELAYCVHKAHWRKGYASDIMSLATSWAKDSGFTELTAEAAKENTASHALLIKSGFTVTGESRFKKYNMEVAYESYLYSKSISDTQ